jgi:threonyl-tRNA synthetase
VFWTHKGTVIFNGSRTRCADVHRERYEEIKTPLLFNKVLWEKSGHWGKYRENMFLVLDEADPSLPEEERASFSLKPMNCPSHHLFYQMKKRSYRELPLRLHTQDVLHRNEATGVLGGPHPRAPVPAGRRAHLPHGGADPRRGRALDEAHREGLCAFGLEFTAKFSTRPEQRRSATTRCGTRRRPRSRRRSRSSGLPYELKPGDGAFYGPKIDFDVADSIGRKWQLGTIQLDYVAPERFDLGYIGEDNAEHRPVVIHRAIYGSFERFIAILIEHFAGNFPVWLAPEQVRILPIAERHHEWADEINKQLRAADLRSDVDRSHGHLKAMIRDAQLAKTPYTLVIGDKEVEGRGVAVRKHGAGKDADLGFMRLEDFLAQLRREATIPF